MESQDQEIEKLKEEIAKLEKSLKWYKATYENRSFLGIIKSKLSQKKKINKHHSLDQQIIKYVKQNHKPEKITNNKLVSIIILSLNRFDDTTNAIKNIYKYTHLPFEIIILDNNSTNDVKDKLKKVEKEHGNLKVIFENKNLGAAGGRDKAKNFAKGDYLLFLDNDILVFPYYLENLINRIESEPLAAGACCKTIFPDGKIQFNGGKVIFDDDYALYSLIHEGLDFQDESTNKFLECQWIPGGTTLWKKEIFGKFSVDPEMKGSFEDNEVSLRLINSGYKLLNSPGSVVIHNHFMFKDEAYKKKEAHYFNERNNSERIRYALLHFYRKHGLIFSFAWKNNPWDLIWKLDSKGKILNFINNK